MKLQANKQMNNMWDKTNRWKNLVGWVTTPFKTLNEKENVRTGSNHAMCSFSWQKELYTIVQGKIPNKSTLHTFSLFYMHNFWCLDSKFWIFLNEYFLFLIWNVILFFYLDFLPIWRSLAPITVNSNV